MQSGQEIDRDYSTGAGKRQNILHVS